MSDLSDARTIVTPISVRFCDTDMIGHVSNVAIAAYAEAGRVAMLGSFEVGTTGAILARLAIDFRRQIHISDVVEVHTKTVGFGRSSIRFQQQVIANGEVAAEVESVAVWFDYERNESVALDERTKRSFIEASRT